MTMRIFFPPSPALLLNCARDASNRVPAYLPHGKWKVRQATNAGLNSGVGAARLLLASHTPDHPHMQHYKRITCTTTYPTCHEESSRSKDGGPKISVSEAAINLDPAPPHVCFAPTVRPNGPCNVRPLLHEHPQHGGQKHHEYRRPQVCASYCAYISIYICPHIFLLLKQG